LLGIVPDEYMANSLIFTLATLHAGDGGYPEGGSLPMTGRMEKTFKDLGGKLLLNTPVQKVIIQNGTAVGVQLKNEILNADAVIVTQETLSALTRLFDKPLQDKWLEELCANTKLAVCTFIGLGVKADITDTPLPEWRLEKPVKYAGQTINEISFFNYTGHEGYAPKGCSVLTTAFVSDTYDFWKAAKDEGRYEEEKQALANQIIEAFCQKYPQAKGNIEVIDIATPLTYERYTGAYHGSWMGVREPGDKMKTYPGFLKCVKGLYFAGHWLNPIGGLPVAVTSARSAAQMVCRQFGVMFKGVT
jgi:phytoene dehydrogenase-like protein